MQRVRRSRYVFFYLDDEYALDAFSMLRGELPKPAARAGVLALAILTGELHRVSPDEFELLLSLPAERWVDAPQTDSEALFRLANMGLVLFHTEDARLTAMKDRDEALSANQWNFYAALYHFMTQWHDVRFSDADLEAPAVAESLTATLEDLVTEHGPPPGPFREPCAPADIRLAGAEREGALFAALSSRRTSRAYDQDVPMNLDQLDAVLNYVFGCHGVARGAGDVVYMKRTSPSGGGLHPIEVYPLISNVAGVPAGIYHYNPRDHGLNLLSEVTSTEVREIATSFMCGQAFFGSAHVSFVLTARFTRSHWKYRRHPKAYAGIMMDAAHLSQTLYLVSAELGLGAFVTVAINGRDIEERLGLDGVSEGVIAIAGCGCRSGQESPLEMRFVRQSVA